ncbi:MAG: M48 family metalloprotease [Sphingopyxis sp.]|nr:M48 family metalloprotease [Sphingopyxis sp.]
MMRRMMVAGLLATAVVAMPQVASAQTSAQTSARETAASRAQASLTALRKHEERMIAIGDRILRAAGAAGWCDASQSLGWTLGELGQYPKELRQHVRTVWDLPDGAILFVSAVAPDGAAARAGIRAGMGISLIDGMQPMRNLLQEPSRHALANSERLIDEALARGPLSIEAIDSAGVRSTIALTGELACPSRFELSAEDEEQAYADGSLVQVTAGMGRYTDGQDDELAGVIAHEIAHNMLRHIPRTQEAGTPRDYRRHLGRYSRISRKMEEEADRLGVWLLAVAGYDPEAPVRFWQRFGPNNDSAHPFGRLHDPWRVRVASIQDELAIMRAAKAVDPDARPALLEQRHADDTPVGPSPAPR